MTLTLELTPELEARLHQEATRRGMSPGDLALRVLEQHVPAADKQATLAELLQSWIDNPPDEEESAANEQFLQELDAGRGSTRKLYPPELKGVTW